jgi:DNA-binding response OmpR family regulator
MRVLVVEDDLRVASFIQRGLEEEGYVPGRSGFQVLRGAQG